MTRLELEALCRYGARRPVSQRLSRREGATQGTGGSGAEQQGPATQQQPIQRGASEQQQPLEQEGRGGAGWESENDSSSPNSAPAQEQTGATSPGTRGVGAQQEQSSDDGLIELNDPFGRSYENNGSPAPDAQE